MLPHRIVGARCAATLALALAAPSPAPAAPAPDLPRILEQAKARQKADVEAWTRFRFTRRSLREDLDAQGAVARSEDLEFVVTPSHGGFDERLVRSDGAPPSPREVERRRDQRRFEKHYATLVMGEQDGGGIDEGCSLGHLLRLSTHRYAGVERRGGVPCHRLDFGPDVTSTEGGIEGRFARAMAGTLWITVEGFHLAAAHARTVRPISIALSLGKIRDLEVTLESQPLSGGVWLPRRIEVRTVARVVVVPLRRRNVYEYTDFVSHDSGSELSAGS